MRRNPTDAEKRLWSMLRNRRLESYKFKRQRIIAPYIVDFVCLSSWLIIEADGSQHADNRGDERREAFLQRAGFRVLRFWNNNVLDNSDGVFDTICAALTDPHPPTASRRAPPSPRWGEGLEGASLG
ncbi:endonuclease domain-containing protein [Sphingomonas tabacisoli]|uniref:Endonuclease domain-containing protein n=1 Tax=Sphingomonas tabacisoli TaxID=2249466 RepID=A0ABW4I4T1_9SPHN